MVEASSCFLGIRRLKVRRLQRRLRKVLLLLQVRRLKSKAAVLRHMLRRVAPRRLVLKALGVLEGLLMLPKLLLLLLPLLLLPPLWLLPSLSVRHLRK